MERGKFIVIEGIDGSGKTTQVKKIEKLLTDNDLHVHVTRECTDNPIGKLLRNLYLPGKRKCDERVINMLYAADRLDHITNEENGMMNILNEGIHVLSDRYYLSSLAYDTYQHIGTDKYQPALLDIVYRNKVNMDLLRPDVTIYIDTPPKIALDRIHAAREDSAVTVYENTEKLCKIRESYRYGIDYLINNGGENIKIVDGTLDPDVLFSHIKRIIKLVLGVTIQEE